MIKYCLKCASYWGAKLLISIYVLLLFSTPIPTSREMLPPSIWAICLDKHKNQAIFHMMTGSSIV